MSQVWFITGSSRGLGLAITEAALAKGDRVFATARNTSTLAALSSKYPNLYPYALDVTDAVAAEKAINHALKILGRLDVVVNNAGYGNVNSIEDTPLEDYRSQIEVNLFGLINVTKPAIPIFRQQRHGHFIQISSIGGRIGPAGRGPYSAAKWGVEGFSEVLDKEMRPFGVKVSIIEPGAFRTDFAGSSSDIQDGRAEYKDTVGRMAEYQRARSGNQIGDPKKAAQVILKVVEMEEPPLRLLLGSDAYRGAEKSETEKLQEARKFKELSLSTDFDEPVKVKAGHGRNN
jgi:NAD(P)-dependent dehydrogenase (short-subunit alcohol dehydrogenase family)